MNYRARLTLAGAILSIFAIFFTPQPASADLGEDDPAPAHTYQEILQSCLPGQTCGPDENAPTGQTEDYVNDNCNSGYYDNATGQCGTEALLSDNEPPSVGYGQQHTSHDQCFNPNNPRGSRISSGGPCPRIWCDGRNPTSSSPRLLADGCGGSGSSVDCDAVTTSTENELCGGGTFDPCSVYPYCSPPPAPPVPPTPPAPVTALAAPIVDCFDDGAGSLAATSEFLRSSAGLTRWDYRVRWLNNRSTGFVPLSLQTQINAAQAALAYAQTPAAQTAAATTAAVAAQARSDYDDTLLMSQQASTAVVVVESQLAFAVGYADNAEDSRWDAWVSWYLAEQAVASLRIGAAPTVSSPTATVADDLLPFQHAAAALIQSQAAAEAADAAEAHRQDAEDSAALADSPIHPQAAVAVAAANAAHAEAENAAVAAVTAEAHKDAIEATLTTVTAERDTLIAEVANLLPAAESAEQAAQEAADAADVTAWQQTLAVLQAAVDPYLIEVDDSPAVSGSQGTSTIRPPLIATFDELRSNIAYRISRRASASNSYGTSYSAWSSWSGWSPWSPLGYDLDDDGDELGNGIQDDLSSCPIPTSRPPGTPGAPCSHDPSQIEAVYPPGHPQAGQPTGQCYPPGSPCLPPPDGIGALDVVCLPRGS